MKYYPSIAGSAPFEVWTPNNPCNCHDKIGDPIPEKYDAKELVTIALLALAVAALIIDDALPGGQADDILLPPLLTKLAQRLAPLLSRLSPVLTAPVLVP